MNRRAFFQSIAKAAAIVALAPQLAFRSKPEAFKLVDDYSFQPLLTYQLDTIDILIDRATADRLNELMVKYYKRQEVF